MKRFIFLIIGLLVINESFSQECNRYIKIDKEQITFGEFKNDVYTQTGIRVYSNSDSINALILTTTPDSIEIFSTLRSSLQHYNYNVICWQGNILVTYNPIEFVDLPKFTVVSDETVEVQAEQTSITETEQRYLKSRGTEIIETITIGSPSMNSGKAKVKISGNLRDKDSGETLIGATIYIEELKVGASTNLNGFFTISIEPGLYNARFDCMGQKSAKYQLNVFSDGELSLSLENSIMQIDEVLVYGDKSINVTTRDAGFERISINTLKELPMMMGERDVIKVSELLPGIVSIGEGISGVNVRGGNFDQNGFYINKVPIYNTSHAFGFFPAFNPDIIKDFSIYKGHMPVEYGGRISSVFNIVTKQGNRKHFNVRGGINPLTSNITLEGPIIKDVGSILVSLRSTYSNWILKRISDPNVRNSSANFNDFVVSTSFEANSKNQINFFTYYSTDYFKLSDINEYNYSNLGSSLEWRRTLSQATRLETAVVLSRYAFGTIDQNIVPLSYEHEYSISHYELRSGLSHIPNDKHRIDAGVSFINYNLKKGMVKPYSSSSIRVPVELGEENGFEGTLYISDTYDPFSWLNLYLGLRYSAYAPLGKRSVYQYAEGGPMEVEYITDTIEYKNNQPIKWYHGPEVRASMNIKTDLNGSVKLAFNQTRQNLFMLNNTITISPNTQWQLANEHIKPLLGQQLSLGLFRNLPKYSSEFSVEFFAKQVEHISEFKDGASFIKTPQTETMVLQGDQVAYGFEVMLRKQKGRFNGWLAYTYSRSIVEVTGKENWMQINQGIAYPSNYDVPHAVNGVFSYRFSRRINLSTTTTYQKGRPITYPLSVYYVNNVPIVNYSNRNEFRIPDYFRVDISLAVEGNLKRRKLFHSSWVFGIYNVTGRNNPLSIYFKLEDGSIKGYKYSIIGTPIFTATWVFKLGNYAAD